MNLFPDLINELSHLCGIIQEYRDAFGQWRSAPAETKRMILRAMGLAVDTEEELLHEIRERKDREWKRFLDPVKVISVNEQPFSLSLSLPVEEGDEDSLLFSWRVVDENGRTDLFSAPGGTLKSTDQRTIEGRRYIQLELPCRPPDAPAYPLGYYTAWVSCSGGGRDLRGEARIIIAPDSCYLPPSLEKERVWGLSLNLYSLRSGRNWGIGDLTDLRETTRWVAGMGGGFIGINPLHCTENRKPLGISPYSPISRISRNCIYLDIGRVQDVAESAEARRLMESAPFRERMGELRGEGLIDYDGVASLKLEILRHAFDHFYEQHYTPLSQRGKAFSSYVSREGRALETHAAYMALSLSLGRDWRFWPADRQKPSGENITGCSEQEKKERLFYMYTQWLMDRQLGEVSEEAQALGMSIGLYHDLALGSVPGGSDAWMFRDVFAQGMDVGAPPDDFCREGQNWGFPPLIPGKLRDSGYDYLIRILRKNMQYGGAIRIDHALGIFRLFWIPQGLPSSEGAYVTYPSEEVLRIIALESVRNNTVVIGEDLGTIGDNVREALSRFGMLSYRLLYFERNYPDPAFTSPDRYPEMALCSVTTHDLPTLYGYWMGRDIELREKMGLCHDREALDRDKAVRERDKVLLMEALSAGGLISEAAPVPPVMSPELCTAVYAYLARSRCKLLAVNLDDVIGTLDQQNLPGQTDSYPSWMQKTPLPLEQIISDPWFSSLSSALRGAGRGNVKA